jgi:hypothetical protein
MPASVAEGLEGGDAERRHFGNPSPFEHVYAANQTCSEMLSDPWFD